MENGDMHFLAGRGRNIKFQVLEGGHLYLNNEDLGQLVESVRQAADLVSGLRSGTLTGMEQSFVALAQRVSQLERAAGNSSTSVDMSGSLNTRIRNLNSKVSRLTLQVRQLQNRLRANECISNPCRNGGTCEDVYDGFICRCPPEWEGTLCDTDVNECAHFAGTDLGCQNGATCINRPGTFDCLCSSGWFGKLCTRKSNNCTISSARDLCGHGLCVDQPGTSSGYACICDQGWTKNTNSPSCTVDVDECASNHPSCSRNPPVPCVNVPGSFYCGGCPAGYTGNGYYCEDINECQVNNGGCSMNPSVQCINTQGSRVCGMCPPGYQGDGVTCTFRGACQINNGGCNYLARCVENPAISQSFVQCICPAGYVGTGIGENGCIFNSRDQPTSNPCSSNPCVNGGICAVSGASFICSCLPGYTGTTCSVMLDPCTRNPCQNGGTCVRQSTGYHCRCTSSFTGTHCDQEQMSCGGTLTSEEGSLKFPPSGSGMTYLTSLSCAWVIITNSTKVLNVTFLNFRLEQSPDCSYDWLQIHDGRTSGDQIIKRFCGTTLPNNGTIISTHNALYLWFRSDHSRNGEGFEISWKSINPVCGGIVFAASHGTLTSPGYPGKYPKNRDCLWLIHAPRSRRIQFHFATMMLENHPNCSFDFVEIRDGIRTNARRLKFCNSSHPEPFTTSGSHAMIRFHSDGESNDAGFVITYSSIPGLAECGGIVGGFAGTISSPNVQNAYRPNLNCEWLIQVTEGERIKITFETFRLETSSDCLHDNVEIHEGNSPTSPLVGRYCGAHKPRPYISNGNTLVITFRSDFSVSFEGFVINYEEVCGGVFSDPTGVITSPGYPLRYKPNMMCDYEIAQPVGTSIILNFYEFSLESSRSCNFDYLLIKDGHDSNAPLVGKYCRQIPPPVVSTQNYLWLQFKSDSSRNERGFYANYTIQDIGCGGILKNETGMIRSPNYPLRYGSNHRCRWNIIAGTGNVLQLSFPNFRIEQSYGCRFDSLDIYDNYTEGIVPKVGSYCGDVSPPIMTSMSNIMTLVFRTDNSKNYGGFQVNYIQMDASEICGGNYSSPMGVLRSPGYPDQYRRNQDCTWIIRVPSGQQLKLNVTDFHLENHYNCYYDYLEIRNGGTTRSPLIGKFCGTTIPPTIPSTANQLYLRFVSDYSVGFQGFEIKWDGTATGCGGTLTSPSGSITSPNYPEPYGRYTECFWKIATSQGSIIQAVIVEMDLEGENCYADYVAFYDGIDSSAKLLGKYCHNSHAVTIRSTSNHMFIKFSSDYGIEGTGFQINYGTACTNTVKGYQGMIESPNFPNNYPSHLDCKWTIKAPRGNKLNISFSHFDLERPCLHDYLQVSEAFNDETLFTDLTEKLCGSALPNNIHSNLNKVQVAMVSDYSVVHSGFHLEWIVDGCGGKFTHPMDEFTSPGYPGNYRDNVECEWTITVPLDKSIQLTIEDLQMEGVINCRFDSLTIYGGPDDTSPKLHEPICHTLSPLPYVTTSSGNNMFIRFVADGSYSGRGFKARYEAVNSLCGGSFINPAGYIHSRNYPNNYEPNDDCMWLIQVAPSHVVELNIIDFEMENHNNCSYDYVRLFDGNSTESSVLATLCGRDRPNITKYVSTGNSMFIRMKADGSNGFKGFKAKYTTACGARIITEDYGVIELTDTLNINRNNVNCSWIIMGARPEDRVTLTVTHMDISPSSENTGDICEYSFLEVRDGEDANAHLRGRYCGSKAPPHITSQGSALFLHLISLYGSHSGQFSAAYSVISSACGGDLTSEHGAIASPNYPDSYPVVAECIWTISTSSGNRVIINFRSFELEESEDCIKDYLEVRENDGAGRLLGVFCSSLPNNITAAQKLWIKFRSDPDTTAAGFVADYSLLHGNDLTGPRGEIASPLYPRPYVQNAHYTWRITADVGMAITITFTDFFIESYNTACEMHLAIYEGFDDTGLEIFKGCGSMLPDPVTSSSNVVYIVMDTFGLRHGSYFKLNWLQVERPQILRPSTPSSRIPGCGGDIYLTDWGSDANTSSYTVQSPGYPYGYRGGLYCEWIIETPPLSHVLLLIQSMDLEVIGTCFLDYVKVWEGVDGTQNWRELKTLCHSNASSEGPIEATNLMKIVFRTDFSVNKTGFSAKVFSVCGGSVRAPNGVIEVHNLTNQYDLVRRYYLKCQWNITVRAGRTIAVTFDRFHIPTDAPGVCTNTYLMLKNGHSQESPLLGNGKYCSDIIPIVPHTTGNHLYVKYSSISGSEGFKMRFTEVSFSCGGNYLLSSSYSWVNISSPNFPNIPIPHTECTWTIMAPAGETIQVDFDRRFHFQYSSECQSEYIELKDGGTQLSRLIGRYCHTAPDTTRTTGNMLLIHYFTDEPEPHTGFKANISLSTCGGTIRGYSGEIMSPGYPRNYPKNIECTWRIMSPYHSLITVQFKELALTVSNFNCSVNDHVTITEVYSFNQTERLVSTLCSLSSTRTLQLASSEAIIKFKSMGTVSRSNNKGFLMNFSVSESLCGGELNSPEGQFESLGYPNGVPSYHSCEWIITVPRGRRITVNLVDVDLNLQAYMSNIYFFNKNYRYMITSLRDNQTMRQIESSSNRMKIYYYSRNNNRHRGFRARYTSDQPEHCGGNLEGVSGTIQIPSSVQNLSSFFCEWTYVHSGSMNQTTRTFAVTILNSTFNYFHGMMCDYHGTKIQVTADGDSLHLEDICRNNTQPYHVLSPYLSTEFTASQTPQNKVTFAAQYQVSPCGGVLSGPEETISSPGYPNQYAANLKCAWVVTFPSGQAIKVHFITMKLESICNDYVLIRNGPLPSSPTIGRYCGSSPPQDFSSQSNQLWIEFHSNGEVQDQGFSLQLTAVTSGCGGIFHRNTGIITSPNFPRTYPDNAECEWDIRVENGYTISLNFIERFDIRSSPGCTKDFIEIFDYVNQEYQSLGKKCTKVKPATMNSTSSQLKVLFRSNEAPHGDGFKAQWNVICGGVVENVTKGQIVSPGFPSPYGDGLYCNYTVRMPGHYIKAHFEQFELEDGSAGCRFDNVSIYNQESYSLRLRKIGTYCGRNIPPSFVTKDFFSLIFQTDRWVTRPGFLLRFEVRSCGGDIREPGTVTLPPTYVEDDYSDINCTWNITAPANSVIVLRFSALMIRTYGMCYNDNSLNIYNGPTISDVNRLGRFCGNHTLSLPVLHSTRNAMVLEYLSYTSARYNYFSVDIIFTHGESVGCGGTLHATQIAQTIRSLDTDRDQLYEPSLDCQWLITAEDGQVVSFDITTMDIKPCINTTGNSTNYCKCDYLEVRDGPSQYSDLIGQYCGTVIPSMILSSVSSLWIRFVSDGDQNGRGFVAQVTRQTSICGVSSLNVTNITQVLTSPNYPGNYPVNLRCRWMLESREPYSSVEIYIEDMDIRGGGRDCSAAKLQISDTSVGNIINEGLGQSFIHSGRSQHPTSIRYASVSPVAESTFCGQVSKQNYYTNMGQVMMTLVTGSEVGKGFKIQYSLPGCTRNYTGVQGRIKLTYIPETCIILIQTSLNSTISLYYSDAYMSDSDNCNSVGFEVRDGTTSSAPVLGRYCGYSRYNPIFSTGPNLQIHLWNTRRGSFSNLDFSYTTTDQGPGCGGTLFNYGGLFTSPYYPTNYRNASTCRWDVTVPVGTFATLRFEVFDLGSSSTCTTDFVELLEVDSETKAETVRTRYCGGDTPAVYMSSNNQLILRYTISIHNTGTGWIAYFMGKLPGQQLYDQMTEYNNYYN